MQIVKQTSELREQIQQWKVQGLKIGFVPTMGNLHAGHLSLVKQAQACCDKVVVSVFVNPLQFGPNEDFDSYPRTYEEDCQKLREAATDLLFCPTVGTMYPNGQQTSQVQVPPSLTGLLEGASRPGHFDGVTTVVAKLFNLVQPDVAVFGQKDYQQYCVIARMVEDLAMPVRLEMASIARDADGLALSSRNQYLTPEQRLIAPKLYTVLLDVAAALRSGNCDYAALQQAATDQLTVCGFDAVDYIRIVDPVTLLEAQAGQTEFAILGVARLGSTRLLDNLLLNMAG